VVPGRTAIGAPVICEGIVRGSMGVSLPEPISDTEIALVGEIVKNQAALIGAELGRDAPDAPRLLGRRSTPSAGEPAGATLQ